MAERVEVDAFKGDWSEAFPNGFPRLATSHERTEVPVSAGSQRSPGVNNLAPRLSKCRA